MAAIVPVCMLQTRECLPTVACKVLRVMTISHCKIHECRRMSQATATHGIAIRDHGIHGSGTQGMRCNFRDCFSEWGT